MAKTITVDEDVLREAIEFEVYECFRYTDCEIIARVEGARLARAVVVRLRETFAEEV